MEAEVDKEEYLPIEDLFAVDISGDGGVLKDVLKEAPPTARSPAKGDLCHVHFIGSIVEEGGVKHKPEDRPVFLNTRKTLGHPFSFVMGEEQTLPGLELGCQTMKEGEIAVLICKPQYGYGMFGNPQGFHSMGTPIPAKATLRFHVEILLLDGLSIDALRKMGDVQRIAIGLKNKEEGNKLFNCKGEHETEKAVLKYRKAIECVDGMDVTGAENGSRQARDLLVSSYSNLAACMLRFDDWKTVVKMTTKVLEMDPQNSKALFRRGKAQAQLGELDSAQQDLEMAAASGSNEEIRNELAKVKNRLGEAKKKEQQLYGGMLAQSLGGLYKDKEEKPKEEPKTKMCTICKQEIETVQWARHVIKMHSSGDKKGK